MRLAPAARLTIDAFLLVARHQGLSPPHLFSALELISAMIAALSLSLRSLTEQIEMPGGMGSMDVQISDERRETRITPQEKKQIGTDKSNKRQCDALLCWPF